MARPPRSIRIPVVLDTIRYIDLRCDLDGKVLMKYPRARKEIVLPRGMLAPKILGLIDGGAL